MKIRPYEKNDWPRVCAIHDAARRFELAAAHLDAAFLTLEQTAENEGFYEYAIRVAVIDERVVGFVAFTDDELAWLYVDPLMHRKGIASVLIQTALQETKNAMTAEVLLGNDAAIATYLKAGFEIVGQAHGCMPGNEGFAVSVTCLQHQGL
ncbi:MAG: GNAT family N-acetyltransferase [Burkholderiaceae bacterium]|nr:MAG: GNAT family N-acetyltransferase [Burkholderiaceae bacterium]